MNKTKKNEKEIINVPHVSNFSDYRVYLRELFNFNKKRDGKYSYQYYGKKSKCSSTLLKLVFKEERHLSLDKVSDVAQSFDLSQEEEHYFYFLYLNNVSQNKFMKDEFSKILNKLAMDFKHVKISRHFNSTNDSLEHVFYDSLRTQIFSMQKLTGFQPEAQWIKSKLRNQEIPLEQIQLVLRELEKEGVFNEENKKVHDNFLYNRAHPYSPTGLLPYQNTCREMANALDNVDVYRTFDVSSLYICLPFAMDSVLVKKIREFRDEIIDLSKSVNYGESLYMINLGLITVSSIDAERFYQK